MKKFIQILLELLPFVFFTIIFKNIALGQNDLLLHLPFNNSINNESQFNLVVKDVGNTSFVEGRNGLSCNALEFDGNNYVTILNNKIFDQIKNEFTITSWLKVTKSSNDDYWLTLICKGDELDETKTNPHFRVQLFQNNDQSTVSVNTEFTEYDSNFMNHRIKSNEWFHFALVCSADKVIVYLNGINVWSFYYSNSFVFNTSPIFIGRDIPGADEFFQGVIDDLKLFNRSLSEAEIIEDMYNSDDVDFSDEINCSDNIQAFCPKDYCEVKVDYLSKSNDPCNKWVSSTITGLPSGSLFPSGTNKVVVKKTLNNSIKFCQFNIEVIDTICPRIECIKDTIIVTDSLPVKISLPKPLVYDNCSNVNLKNLDTIFTSYGKHSKSYYATDDFGNTSTCTQTIEIHKKETQTIKPSIKDSIIVKKTLDFTNDRLTVFVFDHKVEDGDIISLYFNSEEIVHKKVILNKHNNKGEVIKRQIELKKGNNLLTIKAWNTGTSGPNTVRIEFYDGELSKNQFLSEKIKPIYAETINSEIGLASAINLKLK